MLDFPSHRMFGLRKRKQHADSHHLNALPLRVDLHSSTQNFPIPLTPVPVYHYICVPTCIPCLNDNASLFPRWSPRCVENWRPHYGCSLSLLKKTKNQENCSMMKMMREGMENCSPTTIMKEGWDPYGHVQSMGFVVILALWRRWRFSKWVYLPMLWGGVHLGHGSF